VGSLDIWLDKLGYRQFGAGLFTHGKKPGLHPYSSEIDRLLDPQGGIRGAAVFCIDETPVVCFVDDAALPQINKERKARITQMRQKIWNQNLASVLIVVRQNELCAYSVQKGEKETELLKFDEANPMGPWSALEFETDRVQERLPEWFKPEQRVDRRLLANLGAAIRALKSQGINEAASQSLMAQAIFVSYLEHRLIVSDEYRSRHKVGQLRHLVQERDMSGVEKLLRQLKRDFNGDFLIPDNQNEATEAWGALKRSSLAVIADFLGNVDIASGQGSFWHYDFSEIPVELISGIYESFLSERQKALGAYYTPRHLAVLAVKHAFEGFSDISSLKVLDGACGSGIFLTTCYRMMLRAAELKAGRSFSLKKRIQYLQSHIFGSDVDPSACRLTAFSLYLALLENMSPPDISALMEEADTKLPRLIGQNSNILAGDHMGDVFSSHNDYMKSKGFDVYVSNPPWREPGGASKPSFELWMEKERPHFFLPRRQMAGAFAHRAVDSLKPGGRICLILPFGLFAAKANGRFVEDWVSEVRIDKVINLADLRCLLFQKASHPCVIACATKRRISEINVPGSQEVFTYLTPKADLGIALGRIAIHASDEQVMFTRDVVQDSTLFMKRFVGTGRDIAILNRTLRLGTLKDCIRKKGWLAKKGFHAQDNSRNPISTLELKELPFLAADRFGLDVPVFTAKDTSRSFPQEFTRVVNIGGGDGMLYSGPRVLFPDGTAPGRVVRAIYSEAPFCFQSSVAGIGGMGFNSDASILKFLAVYLRSSLATYFLTLTSYALSFERRRVSVEDIEQLPFAPPDNHPDPNTARTALLEVVAILDRLSQFDELQRANEYEATKDRLDQLVLKYFGLSEEDQTLIADSINVTGRSIQPRGFRSVRDLPALQEPRDDEIRRYANTLKRSLSAWRDSTGGKGALEVEVLRGRSKLPLAAVKLSLSETDYDRVALNKSDEKIADLIEELVASMPRGSKEVQRGLFSIPHIDVATDSAYYLVKPAQRRFWLQTSALSDADRLVNQIALARYTGARQ
jgi:N-6 DNA Methylase